MGGAAGKSGSAQGGLTSMATDAYTAAAPAIHNAMKMVNEAIVTGGVGARNPIYGAATEKSLQASNQAERSMVDDFARTGLAGTPFAEAMIAGLRQQGAQNAAMIPLEMANKDYWTTISSLFPAATQMAGMGVQGMGAATSSEASRYGSINQLMSSIYGSTMGGISDMVSAGKG